jgi:hypothetical protein
VPQQSAAQGQSAAPQTSAPATSEESSSPVAIASVAPEQPTAMQLIQQDVDAGTIDEPTGLLYRVYATFGAPELPAKYAAGIPTEDGAAIAQLVGEANDGSLPAEIANDVMPFLVRPPDPTSVFHGSAPPVGARQPFAAQAVVNPSCGENGWASLVSQSVPVTVWGSCTGGHGTDDLASFLSGIESVYGDEVKLMGDPIQDGGSADEGGDSNLDIYVADSCVTRAGQCKDLSDQAYAITVPAPPFEGSPATSSAYMVVDRNIADPGIQRAVLAHELFHVLEFAHNEGGIQQGGQWFWMTEASAEWAEEVFAQDARPYTVYPDVAKYQHSNLGLTTTNGANEYQSFLWSYFMEQQGGVQAVANAWDAFRGQSGFDNLNTALSGIVPFSSKFKDFAVHAWNSDLVVGEGPPDVIAPRFQDLDKDLPDDDAINDAKTKYQKVVGAAGPQGNQYSVDETMPPLSERYEIVDVDDSVQQLVVNFDGLEPSSALDPVALLKYRDGHWERKDLPAGKTTFCRSDYDITKILFVLADHGFSADSAISGTWTMQALTDPCQPTSYKLDLTNVAPSDRPDAGHYEGPAPIECDLMGTDWHAFFMRLQPNNGQVRELTLQTGQYAYIRASTIHSTEDPGDWQIMQNFQSGNVVTHVDDQGGNNVKFTVQATDIFQKIDATITCSVVQRFP